MVFMFRFISSHLLHVSGSMFRVYCHTTHWPVSVYVVGGQGVRLFVVVVSCGVLDVFLLGGFLSRHTTYVSV